MQLGFVVLSYVDRLTFGITADAGSSPDVEALRRPRRRVLARRAEAVSVPD